MELDPLRFRGRTVSGIANELYGHFLLNQIPWDSMNLPFDLQNKLRDEALESDIGGMPNDTDGMPWELLHLGSAALRGLF